MKKINLFQVARFQIAVVITLLLVVLEIGELINIGWWVFFPIIFDFAVSIVSIILVVIFVSYEERLDIENEKMYNDNEKRKDK